jgi:hypothetical protein
MPVKASRRGVGVRLVGMFCMIFRQKNEGTERYGIMEGKGKWAK